MELKKAIEILKHHNQWRRDNDSTLPKPMVNPTELGIAIDVILESFKCQCEIPIVRGVNPEYCGNCGKDI